MVNQVVDASPDPQYGEDKALLDGVTPVWGDWKQTPDGQREFDVHKTQQFPGLDAPAPGPLPGNYQLHLASKASPGMPARDVYIVAVSAVAATLGLCGGGVGHFAATTSADVVLPVTPLTLVTYLAGRYSALSVAGTVISRRTIFPVGPFGRLSTNQIRRGYL